MNILFFEVLKAHQKLYNLSCLKITPIYNTRKLSPQLVNNI